MKRNLVTLLVTILAPVWLFSQSIEGIVTDGNSPLSGANIIIEGTQFGAVSLEDGVYSVDVQEGQYDVTASFIGYSSVTQEVDLEESVSKDTKNNEDTNKNG